LAHEILLYHCEKKALALQLALGVKMPVVIVNTMMCEDCHNFFKAASAYFQKRIECRDGRLTHVFDDGECTCADEWNSLPPKKHIPFIISDNGKTVKLKKVLES